MIHHSQQGYIDWELWIVGGIIVLLMALTILGIYALVLNERSWQEFKVAHHCKVVGRMKGDFHTVTTVNAKGQVGVGTAYSGDKTGWLCDDGVTYWR